MQEKKFTSSSRFFHDTLFRSAPNGGERRPQTFRYTEAIMYISEKATKTRKKLRCRTVHTKVRLD
jgi:hypothetical protein